MVIFDAFFLTFVSISRSEIFAIIVPLFMRFVGIRISSGDHFYIMPLQNQPRYCSRDV